MTATTTSVPTADDEPDLPRPKDATDPFDRDVLPTPRAPPAPCCAPCSPR